MLPYTRPDRFCPRRMAQMTTQAVHSTLVIRNLRRYFQRRKGAKVSELIDSLLAQMTLDEKVSLMAGASVWYTVPVERLGIPAIKMTDGPNGARGETSVGGPVGHTSACFPVGIALGASWDPALVERVGQALAEEARFKGAHILLAPTVNIHRSPLAGRNFECYSDRT